MAPSCCVACLLSATTASLLQPSPCAQARWPQAHQSCRFKSHGYLLTRDGPPDAHWRYLSAKGAQCYGLEGLQAAGRAAQLARPREPRHLRVAGGLATLRSCVTECGSARAGDWQPGSQAARVRQSRVCPGVFSIPALARWVGHVRLASAAQSAEDSRHKPGGQQTGTNAIFSVACVCVQTVCDWETNQRGISLQKPATQGSPACWPKVCGRDRAQCLDARRPRGVCRYASSQRFLVPVQAPARHRVTCSRLEQIPALGKSASEASSHAQQAAADFRFRQQRQAPTDAAQLAFYCIAMAPF